MTVTQPGAVESVSEVVSEPGAVAMVSNNSAKLDDPVATALGSDRDSVAIGSFSICHLILGIGPFQSDAVT